MAVHQLLHFCLTANNKWRETCSLLRIVNPLGVPVSVEILDHWATITGASAAVLIELRGTKARHLVYCPVLVIMPSTSAATSSHPLHATPPRKKQLKLRRMLPGGVGESGVASAGARSDQQAFLESSQVIQALVLVRPIGHKEIEETDDTRRHCD